ncbi:MAG: TIGR00282 family metallophosphoesterase [Chitinivibrionales bacterium]|nr:TIGR00282 family metallophosphoesterase [Chitinivibrionales bacterium]
MRILFIGDIFGTTGRRVLAERLSSLVEEKAVELCIANGENAAGGGGLTNNIIKKFRKYGVQVITGGNHIFSNQDCYPNLENDDFVLRPHNFPPGNVGKGIALYTLKDSRNIGIINLQGRTFLHEITDCPFRTADQAVAFLAKDTKSIFIDFHAEASSEKKALFYYLDGRISALIGTHTHIQTADEFISPEGTAYLTDVGMTGPADSCIGMKPEPVIKKFIFQTSARFEPSNAGPSLNAVLMDIDDSTGKATSISRISERIIFK